jgi:hypothetical protein
MSSLKQLSPFRKMLGILLILVVMIVSLFVGLMAAGGPFWRDSVRSSNLGHVGRSAIGFSLVTGLLSIAALLAGVALYAVVVVTRMFIFDLRRPVWPSVKVRWFLANILVPLPIMLGVSGLVAAIGSPLLVSLGMAYGTAFLVLILVPLILLQLFSIWFRIWTPLVSRLIRGRLRALGVEPVRIDRGILLGISDPSFTSMGKGLIEDDVGMLWIEPDELVYEGDNDQFRIRREQCLSIERVADAAATSAYFGNVNIILTIAEDGAGPRRVRLHPESSMTMTSIARASDRLADELERWKGVVPAGDSVKT